MTIPGSISKVSRAIYEQAADWIVELREEEVDAGTRERLDAWFRESPQHIRAYLELASVWEEGTDPDVDQGRTTDELIAFARSSSNVLPLHVASSSVALVIEEAERRPETAAAPASAPTDPRPHHRSTWRRVWISAAAVACGMIVLGLFVYGERNVTFATVTGEQRFEKLIDGSTIELNSRSRVRVRFSNAERNIDLLEGQALFHVAKDAARPFIVHSDSTLVRAVGTQFDVYRKSSGTTVTVVEGRVAVLSPIFSGAPDLSQSGGVIAPEVSLSGRSMQSPLPGDAQRAAVAVASNQNRSRSQLPDTAISDAPNAIYLSAGEQITVSGKAIPRPTHADPTVATAWTEHQLVFEAAPLNEVAQEFNRYNTRQLIIGDAALREFHITGVFSSADPASLLRFLRTQRDIVVNETDDDIRISKK